jgi:hypothetical protein
MSMMRRSVLKLAGVVVLIAMSVASIWWIRDLNVAFAIFAACGLIAGLAWPRPAALLAPVAAAAVCGVIDISGDKASWGPSPTGFMVLWIACSLPGVICGAIAIALRGRSNATSTNVGSSPARPPARVTSTASAQVRGFQRSAVVPIPGRRAPRTTPMARRDPACRSDEEARRCLERVRRATAERRRRVGLRQLFGMIRKVFFARLGWEYAVAALNASESKMMLYALLPASTVPHLSTKIEP